MTEWLHPEVAGIREKYGMRSTCGRFHVSAGKVFGKWTYLAYDGQKIIGMFSTAASAKAACEALDGRLDSGTVSV